MHERSRAVVLPRRIKALSLLFVFIVTLQVCDASPASRLTLREEGQVELLGRRPTDLARPESGKGRQRVSTLFWLSLIPISEMQAAFQSRRFLRVRYEIKLTANTCIARCNSRNAVSNFICGHNKTLSIAMRVHNPDRSSFNVEGSDPAQAPPGFVEIVGDDFTILHAPATYWRP